MRAATWVHDSPFGPLVVTTTADGLAGIHIGGPFGGRAGRAGRTGGAGGAGGAGGEPVDEVAEALDAYLAGDLAAVDELAVDLGGRTPFSLAVLRALRRVPAGSLTSYGQLADAAGRPGAARAVGGAVGANPVPIVVPCHRVVAGDGGIGGFSCGLHVKRWLLAHEGHAVAGPDGPAVRMRPEPVPG